MKSHIVTDETEGKIQHGSITSGNSGVYERLQKELQKSERLRFAMKEKHKRLQKEYKKKIAKLQQEVGIQKHFSNTLKNMFNDDQIKQLGCRDKRMPKWCDSTLH